MASNVVSKLTPNEALEILGLTLVDLVNMTGLGIGAVRRAVLGGKHHINEGTADLIAAALGVDRNHIAWPNELTDQGRTPLTGGTYVIGASANEKRCPDCNLLLAANGECAICA